jgi:hypothetical protein
MVSGRQMPWRRRNLPKRYGRGVDLVWPPRAGPHQVAQGFRGSVGYPHRRKVTSARRQRANFSASRAIGLDSISGLHRNQGRNYDVAAYAKGSQLPIEDVSGGAGLVAGAQLLHGSKLAHQFSDRLFAVGNRTQRSDFPLGSATATAMVSAWTSKPTNRMFFIDRLLSLAALRRWLHRLTA